MENSTHHGSCWHRTQHSVQQLTQSASCDTAAVYAFWTLYSWLHPASLAISQATMNGKHLAQIQLQTRTQFLRATSFATSKTPMQAIVARSIICQIARTNARNIACTSLAAHNISYNTTSNSHETLDIFVRYFVQQIHGRSWIDRNFET